MTEFAKRLRRVAPYLVEDLLGVSALVVILLGVTQLGASL